MKHALPTVTSVHKPHENKASIWAPADPILSLNQKHLGPWVAFEIRAGPRGNAGWGRHTLGVGDRQPTVQEQPVGGSVLSCWGLRTSGGPLFQEVYHGLVAGRGAQQPLEMMLSLGYPLAGDISSIPQNPLSVPSLSPSSLDEL